MKVFIAILTLLLVPRAYAIEVFACEPEWAALVRELAGDQANITTATTAAQDPHRLEAKPSLIAATSRADLLVCTGADLEIGWLPLLLRRAGNAGIQPGGPGHFLAADYVRKLEVPRLIDRAQGDIHPQGNPHIHLHPRNIARIAERLSERIAALDPANDGAYSGRLRAFRDRWDAAVADWETGAEGLRGLRLAAHHRSFSYLADWLGLEIVATLEPKPGIPPSGAHLAALLEQLSQNPPMAVIRTPFENEKPSIWLSQRLKVRGLILPYTVHDAEGPLDLFELYDSTLAILEELLQ